MIIKLNVLIYLVISFDKECIRKYFINNNWNDRRSVSFILYIIDLYRKANCGAKCLVHDIYTHVENSK